MTNYNKLLNNLELLKLDKIGITLLELKDVSFDIPQKYINKYNKAQEELKKQELELRKAIAKDNSFDLEI